MLAAGRGRKRLAMRSKREISEGARSARSCHAVEILQFSP